MGYLRVLQAYQQFQKVLHSEAGTCLDDLRSVATRLFQMIVLTVIAFNSDDDVSLFMSV